MTAHSITPMQALLITAIKCTLRHYLSVGRITARYLPLPSVVTEVCSQRGCCHASLSGCGLLPGRRIARAADAATAMMGGRLSWRFARYERVAADHASWAERRGLHATRRAFGRDNHTRYVGVGARLPQLVGYLFCIAAVFVGIAA